MTEALKLPYSTSRSSHLASPIFALSSLSSMSFSLEYCIAQMPSSFLENASSDSRTSRKASGSCVFSTRMSFTLFQRTTRILKRLSALSSSTLEPTYSSSSAAKSGFSSTSRILFLAFSESFVRLSTWRFSPGTSSKATCSTPDSSTSIL